MNGKQLIGNHGQDLVVVNGVEISLWKNRLPYQYYFPDTESSLPALKDLYKAGLYVWDVNKVK